MSDDPFKPEEASDDLKGQSSLNSEELFRWRNETASRLYEEIQNARQQIADDEMTEQLSVRDVRLTALICGLEEADQLADIAAEAREALGRDSDDVPVTRAEALRLLIRVGLQEATPETVRIAVEANKEYLANQAEEF